MARIEIKAYYPKTDIYFNYFDYKNISSIKTALV